METILLVKKCKKKRITLLKNHKKITKVTDHIRNGQVSRRRRKKLPRNDAQKSKEKKLILFLFYCYKQKSK